MAGLERFRISWVLVSELAVGPAPRAERHLDRLKDAETRKDEQGERDYRCPTARALCDPVEAPEDLRGVLRHKRAENQVEGLISLSPVDDVEQKAADQHDKREEGEENVEGDRRGIDIGLGRRQIDDRRPHLAEKRDTSTQVEEETSLHWKRWSGKLISRGWSDLVGLHERTSAQRLHITVDGPQTLMEHLALGDRSRIL